MPISLAAGQQDTFTQGGATVENNNSAVSMSTHIDFASNQVAFNFTKGTPATNAFVPGTRSDAANIAINLGNGKWSTSTGLSGTLTGGQLTSLKADLATQRNRAETIAVALGLYSGGTIPTTWP